MEESWYNILSLSFPEIKEQRAVKQKGTTVHPQDRSRASFEKQGQATQLSFPNREVLGQKMKNKMADEADETWMKEAIGLVGNNNLCTNFLKISVSQTLARLDVPL